ncbi:MAG: hypothetical protein IPK75_00720 [Acidobacteria bacterium]|jgi:hypothetical protein|nr:hypothetical protein [Acidobacteriota bacterium]
MRLRIPMATMALLMAAACGEPGSAPDGTAGLSDVPESVASPEPVETIGEPVEEAPLEVNAALPGLRFLQIGMTAEELKAHDTPMTWGTRSLEGEEYETADVELAPGAVVTATFDLEDKLYSLEIASLEIRDNHGTGAGSTLEEVQQAYPEGRLAYGLEEGRYATFLTGGLLVFQFDPADLPETCFEPQPLCEPPVGIKARRMVIYGQPIPA